MTVVYIKFRDSLSVGIRPQHSAFYDYATIDLEETPIYPVILFRANPIRN
ncbi:hypothetical protein RintRC_4421 [Richelia intracellularis]|nr:hypothetical protein RintRC_4421 [Richelia intracellularis]